MKNFPTNSGQQKRLFTILKNHMIDNCVDWETAMTMLGYSVPQTKLYFTKNPTVKKLFWESVKLAEATIVQSAMVRRETISKIGGSNAQLLATEKILNYFAPSTAEKAQRELLYNIYMCLKVVQENVDSEQFETILKEISETDIDKILPEMDTKFL